MKLTIHKMFLSVLAFTTINLGKLSQPQNMSEQWTEKVFSCKILPLKTGDCLDCFTGEKEIKNCDRDWGHNAVCTKITKSGSAFLGIERYVSLLSSLKLLANAMTTSKSCDYYLSNWVCYFQINADWYAQKGVAGIQITSGAKLARFQRRRSASVTRICAMRQTQSERGHWPQSQLSPD